MLNQTKIFSIVTLLLFFFVAGISFAQEDSSKSHMNHDHNMEMKKDDHKHMNHDKMMDTDHKEMKKDDHKHMDHDKMMGADHKEMMKDKEPMVQEGTIDLTAIDENEDGKVYQDQMCWDVLSDKAGECPRCGMKLKEVSLEQAKKNLEENGFEVK